MRREGEHVDVGVTVLVADDHAAVRDAVEVLLATNDGFRLVAAAANGEEALRLALSLRPQVALLDLRMPRLDGVEATRQIRLACPGTRVVVMTAFADRNQMRRAREAGAIDCLLKDGEPTDLLAALRAAALGEIGA